jgi:hypothetical protein
MDWPRELARRAHRVPAWISRRHCMSVSIDTSEPASRMPVTPLASKSG